MVAIRHPALSTLFADYRSLTADTAPTFELVLIGGLANAVIEMGNTPSTSERQAAELFGLIPAAAAIAVSDDAPPQPSWRASEVDGLTELRSAFVDAVPAIAAAPDNLMLRLVPNLRAQFTQDAGDPTMQIRMAWLRTMEALVDPAEHDIAAEDLHRILADTIRRHEQSVLDEI